MIIFQGPRQDVQSLAFVPGKDGGWLAAGYWGDLVLFPLCGGTPTEFPLAPADQLPGTSGLEELAVSPDGKWIVGRWYRGTRLWRRDGRRWTDAGMIRTSRLGSLAVAFRGKDVLLVDGRQDPADGWAYRIYRGRPDRQVGAMPHGTTRDTESHPGGVVTFSSLALPSPNGRSLATAAREKAVQVWNARTGKHAGMLPQRGFVEALAWSPDGETLALNAGTTVRLYDVKTLTERLAWPVKYSYRPRLAFSPDGRLLATTDTSTGVHLWDADTGARRMTLRAGRERRVPVAFAPDGLTIAAGGGNGSVAVWDV